MKIGNLELKNPIFLAPMAGITDMPYREICIKMGAGLSYTEMVSAKGLYYNNENTKLLLERKDKGLTAVQIFGSEPEIMAQMAQRLEELGFPLIDINMGCPAPKIVKNGEGSALMQKPELVYKIVKAVAEAVKIPVTVKMRKGFRANDANAPEIAKIAEQAGALAVAVHGRTREQYYGGNADREIIKKVKEAVSIPVIGNGDINSLEEAKTVMSLTGCDGVMIGRAAMGNPWIFSGEKDLNLSDIAAMILSHAEALLSYKGVFVGIREMRKHACWYLKGIPHANELRGKIQRIEDLPELRKLLHADLNLNLK